MSLPTLRAGTLSRCPRIVLPLALASLVIASFSTTYAHAQRSRRPSVARRSALTEFETRLVRFGGVPETMVRDQARVVRDAFLAQLIPARSNLAGTRIARAYEHEPQGVTLAMSRVTEALRSDVPLDLLDRLWPRTSSRESATSDCYIMLRVRVQLCDAMMAAIREESNGPGFVPVSDGEDLRRSLEAAGTPRDVATRIIAHLMNAVDVIPRSGSAMGPVVASFWWRCPTRDAPGLDRLRAWHSGPTVDMARCLPNTLRGGSEEGKIRLFATAMGLGYDDARAWIRWAAPSDLGTDPPTAAAVPTIPPPGPATSPSPGLPFEEARAIVEERIDAIERFVSVLEDGERIATLGNAEDLRRYLSSREMGVTWAELGGRLSLIADLGCEIEEPRRSLACGLNDDIDSWVRAVDAIADWSYPESFARARAATSAFVRALRARLGRADASRTPTVPITRGPS